MSEPLAEHHMRVKVFVDFWNFQLSLNALPGEVRFEADWRVLGGILARAALDVVDEGAGIAYQGMDVYGSYGEGESDLRLRQWAENTLSTFPGVHVEMLPRRKVRNVPVCPSCRMAISNCPSCRADMRGMEEKGVDTRITTAMISLAWADNYDVALLVSSDRDFVPVVESVFIVDCRRHRPASNAQCPALSNPPLLQRPICCFRIVLGCPVQNLAKGGALA